MYKYLLWDIDGTVLDFLAAEKAAIQSLFLKYNFGPCTDEMVEHYSAINVRYWQMLERNEMTKPEILVGRFRAFFAEIGMDVSQAESFNADYQIALGDTIVFCDDAFNILCEEKKHHQLIAITNGTAVAQHKKLTASGLKNVFDHIFISEEVGFEKPNREYFEHVIREVEIADCKEALIIGDSLTSDIRGGLNIGIDTCWYNPQRKLNSDSSVVPTYEISDLHQLSSILAQKE